MTERRLRLVLTAMCGVGILLTALHLILFPDYNTDKVFQISAAKGLVEGRGYTHTRLPVESWEPVRGSAGYFPVGYSLLVAGLLTVTWDVMMAATSLEVLATVLFFVSWRGILLLLAPWWGAWAVLGVAGYWAVAFNPLLSWAYATDMIALAVMSAALWIWLTGLSRGTHDIRRAVAVGALMGLCMWLRSAYWPLIAIFPLATVLARLPIERPSVIAAVAMAATSALVGGASEVAIPLLGGGKPFSGAGALPWAGPFWSHLLRFEPFPSTMLGVHMFLSQVGSLGPHALRAVGWVCSIVLIAAVLVALRASWRRSRGSDGTSRAARGFLVWGVITTLLIVTMLCFLSLVQPMQLNDPRGWTYVQEHRYYAPAVGFFFVLIFAFITRPPEGGRYVQLLRPLVIVVVMGAAVTIMSWRHSLALGTVTTLRSWQRGQDQMRSFWKEVDSVVAQGRPTFYSGRAGIFRELAVMGGATLLADKVDLKAMPSDRGAVLYLGVDARAPDAVASVQRDFNDRRVSRVTELLGVQVFRVE